MHHNNFLKATGHQCCLSALYSGYSAGGLQRTHSRAKNTPTSLYTLVDYLIITLLRAKSNYCFTSQVSFLLIHKVSSPSPIGDAWVPWQQLGCWGSSALAPPHAPSPAEAHFWRRPPPPPVGALYMSTLWSGPRETNATARCSFGSEAGMSPRGVCVMLWQ